MAQCGNSLCLLLFTAVVQASLFLSAFHAASRVLCDRPVSSPLVVSCGNGLACGLHIVTSGAYCCAAVTGFCAGGSPICALYIMMVSRSGDLGVCGVITVSASYILIPALFAAGCSFCFMRNFIMCLDGDGGFCSAQFLFADRAVNNGVIAACCCAGCFFSVFLNCCSLCVSGQLGNCLCLSAQFCRTFRTVNNRIIAACRLAGCFFSVFLNRRSCRMSSQLGKRVGFRCTAVSLTASYFSTRFLTTCGVFYAPVAPVVGKLRNGFRCRGNNCSTLRAANYFVVAACCCAGCRHNIFLRCSTIGVSRLANSFCFRCAASAAGTGSLLRAVCRAGGCLSLRIGAPLVAKLGNCLNYFFGTVRKSFNLIAVYGTRCGIGDLTEALVFNFKLSRTNDIAVSAIIKKNNLIVPCCKVAFSL